MFAGFKALFEIEPVLSRHLTRIVVTERRRAQVNFNTSALWNNGSNQAQGIAQDISPPTS